MITWFLLQCGVIITCRYFKDYKLHLLYGLVQCCCLWNIYSCLFTPNCTWNNVVTYANINAIIFRLFIRQKKTLRLSKWKIVSLNLVTKFLCWKWKRGKDEIINVFASQLVVGKSSYLKESLELFAIFYRDLTEQKIQKRGRAISVDYYNPIHSTLPNFLSCLLFA